MQIFVRWAIGAVALYITVMIAERLKLHLAVDPGLPGVIASVIAVAVLSVVNAVIRPIVKLLALPITCLTLGLFSFVINACMFWLVFALVPGLLKSTASLHLTGHIYGVILFSCFSGLTTVEGGLRGHALAWMAAVPMSLLLLLELWDAFLWVVLCFLVTIVIGGLELAEHTFPKMYDVE